MASAQCNSHDCKSSDENLRKPWLKGCGLKLWDCGTLVQDLSPSNLGVELGRSFPEHFQTPGACQEWPAYKPAHCYRLDSYIGLLLDYNPTGKFYKDVGLWLLLSRVPNQLH